VPLLVTFDDEDEGQIEKRTLIEWAGRFAKPGSWADVRSYQLWCCKDGVRQLRVSLRVNLFKQVPSGSLANLTQRKFAKLARLYGVGLSTECRSRGERAVELTPEFIQELLDTPQIDGRTETSDTRSREGNRPSSVNFGVNP
jgi:hypothetical protein